MFKIMSDFIIGIKLNAKYGWFIGVTILVDEIKRLAQNGNLHKMPQTIILNRIYQIMSK